MFLHMRNFGLLTRTIILALEIGRDHFLQKIVNISIEVLTNQPEKFLEKIFQVDFAHK